MEGTRLRGGSRLCRERPKSFLVPREGSAVPCPLSSKRRAEDALHPEHSAIHHQQYRRELQQTPEKDPIRMLKTRKPYILIFVFPERWRT
jgi:hypothetical protein